MPGRCVEGVPRHMTIPQASSSQPTATSPSPDGVMASCRRNSAALKAMAMPIAASARTLSPTSASVEDVGEGRDAEIILGDEWDRDRIGQAAPVRARIAGRCQKDSRWTGAAQDALANLESIDVRELDVQEDKVGIAGPTELERLGAARGLADNRHAARLDKCARDRTEACVIIDNQHRPGHTRTLA